jgi:stage V sporulation protein SpoVS
MEQTQPDGVVQIMGGQLNSASSSEVQARKTGDIIQLMNDWEIQRGCLSEVGIDWSTYGHFANLASWFCLEVQDLCLHTVHNRYEQGVACHQPGGTATYVCKKMARYVKQKGNDFHGLGRWCSMLLYADKTINFESFLLTALDGRLLE